MRLKKYKDWLNENGNAQMGITSIDNPGGFIYNPLGEEEDDASNYMFFSNLRRIRELSSMMSKMDSAKIDELLNNGHDWANTHVNTAKTNLDHVFEFFKSELNESENSLTEGAAKTVDLHRQYTMTPSWWAAWRLENEKDSDYKITKDAFSKTYEVQKGDKTLFVYDYKRNTIFTNESPSIFVLKDEVDSEEMDKINNKADDIKDDLAGVDKEEMEKAKEKVAKAEGEEETDKTEEE
jgi:hypothetical protein